MTGLMWTYVEVLVVLLFIKFAHRVYKRIGDRANMDDVIDKAENKMNDAADQVAGYWKSKRKQRKQKEQERPIVTIR